jgi:hypothetical protein
MGSGNGEFIFIDESGDPGYPGANPLYLLVASHMSEAVHRDVTAHVAGFRYFHGVNREFKDWGGLLKSPPTIQWRTLMEYLCGRTVAGEITTTATWLDKATYKANKGPYLVAGKSTEFRHFQVRMLLERHRKRRTWGVDVDIVLDRWSMSQAQRINLENYIKDNWHLQPIGHVTTVDSAYADALQIVDLLARLARRVADGSANTEEITWAGKLMDLQEVKKGLY